MWLGRKGSEDDEPRTLTRVRIGVVKELLNGRSRAEVPGAYLDAYWCQNGLPWFWPSALSYSRLALKSAVTAWFFWHTWVFREVSGYERLFSWHA